MLYSGSGFCLSGHSLILKKNKATEKKPNSKCTLKGLSHEIDFKNVDENGQILALTRAAAGF
jgi:hypothetical protein